ncbi:MAG: LysR substrate-binding domain-containing protein [Notoacmeibacter sp.]
MPVVQAALDGEGIALGWMHLVKNYIASGRIVAVANYKLKTGDGFYVVWPKGRPLSINAARVKDWIVKNA